MSFRSHFIGLACERTDRLPHNSRPVGGRAVASRQGLDANRWVLLALSATISSSISPSCRKLEDDNVLSNGGTHPFPRPAHYCRGIFSTLQVTVIAGVTRAPDVTPPALCASIHR
jgi:hypothetical protein